MISMNMYLVYVATLGNSFQAHTNISYSRQMSSRYLKNHYLVLFIMERQLCEILVGHDYSISNNCYQLWEKYIRQQTA